MVASNFDTLARNEECVELENKEPENLLPLNQETDIVGSDNHQDASPDPEKIEQEEAATRVQAALRGYLVIFLLLLSMLKLIESIMNFGLQVT